MADNMGIMDLLTPQAETLRRRAAAIDTGQADLERSGGYLLTQLENDANKEDEAVMLRMARNGAVNSSALGAAREQARQPYLDAQTGVQQNLVQQRYAARKAKLNIQAMIPGMEGMEIAGRQERQDAHRSWLRVAGHRGGALVVALV